MENIWLTVMSNDCKRRDLLHIAEQERLLSESIIPSRIDGGWLLAVLLVGTTVVTIIMQIV